MVDPTDQVPTKFTNNISARAAPTPVGIAFAPLVGKTQGIPEKEEHQTQVQIKGDSSLEQEVSVSESLAG